MSCVRARSRCFRVAAVAIALAISAGCRESTRRASDVDASVAPPVAAPAAPPPIVEMPVSGHLPSVLVIPPPDGKKRPLLVVAHGAWDRPEWHCGAWRTTVADRGVVLCPRGVPTIPSAPPDQIAFYYPSHLELAREVTDALAALRASHADEVDLERPLYAGFSQGAIDGALLLPTHPAGFARAALIEGGNGEFAEWGLGPARAFKKNGGERVLFACGRAHCEAAAKSSATALQAAGILSEIVYVQGAGHTYGDGLEQPIRTAFAWLVEGDSRWQ
jgi:predicted esterase